MSDSDDINYIKTIKIQSKLGLDLTVYTREVISSSIHLFTWPSAFLLAAYVASHPSEFEGKTILELGSGTALPSIVAAKLGAKRVLVSDRVDEAAVLQNLQQTIALNDVSNIVDTVEIHWGKPYLEMNVDFVIAADIFYSSDDFDDILCTVSSIIASNRIRFLTIYQERSKNRSIVHLLHKYGLKASTIRKEDFLHSNHSLGSIPVKYVTEQSVLNDLQNYGDSDDESEPNRTDFQAIKAFDGLHVIVIESK